MIVSIVNCFAISNFIMIFYPLEPGYIGTWI